MSRQIFDSLDEAYQQTLRDVLHFPQYVCSPRGLQIKEILGYSFTVNCPLPVPIRTADEKRNEVIANYTKAEFELYDSKTRDAEEYARASAFWRKIKNPDGTINSAYGYLIFDREICGNPKFHGPEFPGREMRTPWKWAMDTLIFDKDSRQAIMTFNTPDVLWMGNKDVTCTLTAQFFIREDKLHLFINMRSNDVVRGLVYDCVWFASLLTKALQVLKPVYPNLSIGTYTHYAHSMHIYSDQFDIAEKMLHVVANK